MRSFSKGDKCRKPNLQPYIESADPKFNVSYLNLYNIISNRIVAQKTKFLSYLGNWQREVDAREGFRRAEKAMMTLSKKY